MYFSFIPELEELINIKISNNNNKPDSIENLKFLFIKKNKNNPIKNKTKGILFPESNIPVPSILTASKVNINLTKIFSLNIKLEKTIEKKAKPFI